MRSKSLGAALCCASQSLFSGWKEVGIDGELRTNSIRQMRPNYSRRNLSYGDISRGLSLSNVQNVMPRFCSIISEGLKQSAPIETAELGLILS